MKTAIIFITEDDVLLCSGEGDWSDYKDVYIGQDGLEKAQVVELISKCYDDEGELLLEILDEAGFCDLIEAGAPLIKCGVVG